MSSICRNGIVLTLGVFALSLSGLSPTASAQNAASEGIDFVLLVDVSRSMVTFTEKGSIPVIPDGSDPQRIRWDAAKLLLDLLGPGDRLMVCRFNHACPPVMNESGQMQDDEKFVQYFRENPKDFMNAWRADFNQDFDKLPMGRVRLATGINQFNRDDDNIPGQGIGYLDVGGTRIIGALSTIASRLKTSFKANPSVSTDRPIHVILLTDGLDEDYEAKKYADYEAETDAEKSPLRSALGFYTGDDQLAIRQRVRIPVHCVGLNLAGQGNEKAKKSRHLLGQISKMSGGTFQEVRDSSGLMKFFLCMTKNLRRYWYQEITDPQVLIHETTVTNDLVELGILSFRESLENRPKYAIEPTVVEPKLDWSGVDEAPTPDLIRTGKDASLYRYYYFGRSVDSAGGLQASPFSKITERASLGITIPRDPNQRLVLLKGTVKPLFEMIIPEANSPAYRRHEILVIQAEMISSRHFQPTHFELTATVRLLAKKPQNGDADSDRGPIHVSCATFTPGQFGQEDHELRSVPLSPGTLENEKIVFTGEIPILSLPATTNAMDSYEITVTARGLTGSHALSDMQQDLPPRMIDVQNSLVLEAVSAVELSTDEGGDACEFEIKAVSRTGKRFGDIPLKMEFRAPRETKTDTALNAECFQVLTSHGTLPQLILKDGRAKIRLSLNRSSVPERGQQYSDGELLVTHAEGEKMMKSLRIPLQLRLDLAKVQFKSAPTEIVAKSELVTSDPISVIQSGKGKFEENLTASVSLKFLGPVDEDRSDPSTFDETELWVEKVGGIIDSSSRQRVTLKIGNGSEESFRIHLHPRGVKTPMKYRCRLVVSGAGINTLTHNFFLNKDAATIEIDPAEVSIAIGRGISRRIPIKAWLRGGIEDEHADDVHLDGIQAGQSPFFGRQGTENQGDHFQVFGPDLAIPVKLSAAPSELSFQISVPEDTPYGRYFRDLKLVGSNVTSRTIRMNVVVNGLEFDIFNKSSVRMNDLAQTWQPFSSKSLIQLLNTNMKQTLRIRTGLGEPLEKEELDVRIVGLFQAENGDPVQGKVVVSDLRLTDDRSTAEFDIDFPKTSNRNAQGLPYVLNLAANAKSAASENWFINDAKVEFKVRYLDKTEVIEFRKLPIPVSVPAQKTTPATNLPPK